MNNQIAEAMLRYKTHVSDMKENYCRELSMRYMEMKISPPTLLLQSVSAVHFGNDLLLSFNIQLSACTQLIV